MKYFHFFLEYPSLKDKRKATRKNIGNHAGNVIALVKGTQRPNTGETLWDYICGAYTTPNSPCCYSSCGSGYLSECCKRISEAQAREIHPNIFKYLEN